MSLGFPILPSGIVFSSGSITSFGRFATMSVSIIPGATAFTLIFFGASSLARDFVNPFTANLLVGYIEPLGCP